MTNAELESLLASGGVKIERDDAEQRVQELARIAVEAQTAVGRLGAVLRKIREEIWKEQEYAESRIREYGGRHAPGESFFSGYRNGLGFAHRITLDVEDAFREPR